jgi:Cu(I)/Ag(I) efflux system membrane fusion protein
MRFKSWLIALAGFVLGVALIALLPERTLFAPRETHPVAETATGERWACPMMDFIGTKPGTCPVCGMELQRVTAGELTREQQRRMGVELSQVAEGSATVTVRAYGAADYDHRYTHVVIPRVAGRIVKRYDATFGCCQEVAAGEPIVDLYSPEVITAQGELAAAVKLGHADLVKALRARFERWNLSAIADELVNGGAIRDVVTIHSAFGGQVLLAEMDAVNEALEVGREVTADTPLVRLVDPDRLTLVVHVPETRARFLSEGQPVAIESDDRGPLPELKATIGRLGQEIALEARTREVRIYLTGARSVLQPGSLVSARIQGALDSDLRPADPLNADSWGRFALVPKTAVLSTGVRNVAWRVAGRDHEGRIQFELAPLALGPRIEDENGNDVYVVRAGLKPGDEVATQGAFLIDSQAQLAGTKSLLFPLGASAADSSKPPAHQH